MAVGAAVTRPAVENDWHDSFFLLGDPAMQPLEAVFAAMAGSELPLLLIGEEGTGRTSAAHAIHRIRCGSDEGLVAMNAAEVTPELLPPVANEAASLET